MNILDYLYLECWVTAVNCKLYLVREDYYCQNASSHIAEVSRPEIIFSIMDKILLLGGGRSGIFHRAKAEGLLTNASLKTLKLTALSVRERNGNFIKINVDEEYLKRYKTRYLEFLKKSSGIESDDWLDYV
ncbi:hypothetical protein MUG10_09605 [Xanthomonas prunicola]|uniref:Uncharacterized protein n=1 Tax=Xanthomonas prunicola TaxID=2053930 RepID=A0A9Q9J707_9XANT|nr:hypothetical protein [Xanthomonas prunicola]USJ02322.1 hypothetical protein MUG10_09605 [Xanthomonas prunicola]UXA50835.1 hypothetical protein M0D44_10335 [Xanthomonas prunicola]UXA59142.1 hypothetical protein M0D47_10370 [Xanthomonas prunicola]UXA61283.1 hypothetical protein M0D48_20665 [Xanthomonas prunicola]UXA67351.1 hypothetical protein M0D43_10600 [Xanthomonas prunicola]